MAKSASRNQIFGNYRFDYINYCSNFSSTQLLDMRLTSPAFANNSSIPTKYTCDGEHINPPLEFLEVPAGTKTLALILEDPDVPRQFRPDGMFDHWIVWNIPASTKVLAENSPPPGTTGQNGRGTLDYVPPCPPDREHRYFFKLFALDTILQLPPTSNKSDLLRAMNGHVIETVELMGTYNRQR
jgi:Raf kinase inhibitor-like YbhB/YbcL family protein